MRGHAHGAPDASTVNALSATFAGLDVVPIDVTAADYGAVGNGVTDDTAAVQAALNVASNAGGGMGGRVTLPGKNRTYVIEGTLNVGRRVTLVIPQGVRLRRVTSTTGSVVHVSAHNARIEGGGRIESAVALTDGIVRFAPVTTEAIEWGRVSDVVISGPGEAATGSVGLYVSGHGAAGATFQNLFTCEINNVDIGVRVSTGGNANDFQNIVMWDIGTYAYYVTDAGQWRILGGYIHSSPGITVLKIEDSYNGRVIGLGAEAGAGSTGYDINAGCLGVALVGTNLVTDAGFEGTDAGVGTVIIDRQIISASTVRGNATPGNYGVNAKDPAAAHPAMRMGVDATGAGRIAFGRGDAPAAATMRVSGASDQIICDEGYRVVGDTELDGALNHDGSTVGFYGTAPVAKAANPGVAAGTDAAVINALITALRNLGLVT